MENHFGYQKLIEALKSLGQPTSDILESLVAMAGDIESDGEVYIVRNVKCIAHLLEWLPDIEDAQLQIQTVTSISELCSYSLQRLVSLLYLLYALCILTVSPCLCCSKALCCQKGLLDCVIATMENHGKLHLKSSQQLLRLIQSLGSHSIAASELKRILRLMREAEGPERVCLTLIYIYCCRGRR